MLKHFELPRPSLTSRRNVQTFLPFPDFERSANLLDYRRLGKQRVEALQILRALGDASYGWQNHPAVRQWRGYEPALRLYKDAMIREWIARGYKNNMPLSSEAKDQEMPPWLGMRRYHLSHRSNLLRKDPTFYRRHRWKARDDYPYVWPFVDADGKVTYDVGRN